MSLEQEVQNNTAGIASLNAAKSNLVRRMDQLSSMVPDDASSDNRFATRGWATEKYDSDIADLKKNKVETEGGVILSKYLPGYVDDVLEYEKLTSFPVEGVSGKLYVDTSTRLVYRWSGSGYVEISPSTALGETNATAFPGDRGKALETKVSGVEQRVGKLDTAVEGHTKEIAGKRDYEDLSYDKPYGPARYHGFADDFLANAPIVRLQIDGGPLQRIDPFVFAQETGSTGPILQWGNSSVFLRWEIMYSGYAKLTFSAYGDTKEELFPFMDDNFPIPARYSVLSHGQTFTWYISTAVDELVKKSDLEKKVENLLIETTWQNLVNLSVSGELIAGMQYRITDYAATTVQEHTQSANHRFDIIVTADSAGKLNEAARAIRHEGDEYFANCKLEAWQIWYSLHNDTNRFEWADEENGKGVIYRMIDEWNNDLPYDFKGIKMQACISEGTYSEDYRYTFGVSEDDSKQVTIVGGDEKRGSYSNKIKPYRKRIYDDVGNFISAKLSINLITFGLGCYGNTLGSNCSSNTFGSGCNRNTLGSDCEENTFGSGCNENTLGSDCYYNTFGSSCSFNTFGQGCSDNTFGSDCLYNFYDSYCRDNTLGSDCYSNTFGLNCFGIIAEFSMRSCEVKVGVMAVTLEPTEENGYENLEVLSIIERANAITTKV